MEYPPRGSAGVFPMGQDSNAINPHISDSRGNLVRILKSRVVGNGFRVEQDDVSVETGLKESAIPDAESLRDGPRHLANGILQRDGALVSDVLA